MAQLLETVLWKTFEGAPGPSLKLCQEHNNKSTGHRGNYCGCPGVFRGLVLKMLTMSDFLADLTQTFLFIIHKKHLQFLSWFLTIKSKS